MPHALLLRPGDSGERSAKWLRDLGWNVTLSPLLEIVATGETAELDGVTSWTITSARSLDFLPPEILSLLRTLPVGCVGEATATRLKVRGCEPAHVAPDAQTLGHRIAEAIGNGIWPGGVLLDIGARERAFDLAGVLPTVTAHRPWAIYEALAVALKAEAKQALRDTRIDAVWLTSPRIARSFLHEPVVATLGSPPALIAMSSAVADVIRDSWPGKVHVADTPDEAALVRATRDAVAHRRRSRHTGT